MKKVFLLLFAIWMVANATAQEGMITFSSKERCKLCISEEMFAKIVSSAEPMYQEEFDDVMEDFPFKTSGSKEPAFLALIANSKEADKFEINVIIANVKRGKLHVYIKQNCGWVHYKTRNKNSPIWKIMDKQL